jgi:hypothetical protein
MVHLLNKGGGGKDTLEKSSTERKGAGSGRTAGSPTVARDEER